MRNTDKKIYTSSLSYDIISSKVRSADANLFYLVLLWALHDAVLCSRNWIYQSLTRCSVTSRPRFHQSRGRQTLETTH
ncbi:hypothetical protein TNCV_3914131 [Trichonephila clavipes]|nr:hypothetical protein TNCV_3914131 [Trichonephila clavipes]